MKKDVILRFAIFLFINLYIYRGLIIESGYLINGDLTQVFTSTKFCKDYFPLWNEYGSFSNVFRLPQVILYFPVFILLSNVHIPMSYIYFIYFVIFGSISAMGMYSLTKYSLKLFIKHKYSNIFRVVSSLGYVFRLPEDKNNEKLIEIASISSALGYILSTYVVEHVTHPAIRIGYYLSPWIFLFFIRSIEEFKLKFALITAIVWSLAVSQLHWLFYGIIIFGIYILIIIFQSLYTRNFNKIKNCLLILFVLIGAFILINFYWLIPYVISRGYQEHEMSQGNLITWEDIRCGYRNADLANIFALKGNYNLYARYGDIPPWLNFFDFPKLNFLMRCVVIFALLFFVLHEINNRLLLFFKLLFLISIFLSAGPRFAPNLAYFFLFKSPGHIFFQWIFRTPKFHQFTILSAFILLSFSGYELYRQYCKKPNLKKLMIFPLIVVTISLIVNYPIITGDFNGNNRPMDIPREYKNVILFFNNLTEDYKIVWGPPYGGLKSIWHECGIGIGDLENDISPKPTLDNPIFRTSLDYPVLFGFRGGYNSIVLRNETQNLAKFYSPIYVKYIAIHNDIPGLKEETNEIIKNIKYQKDVELVFKDGFISVYALKNTSSRIRVLNKLFLLYGGVEAYNSLTYLNEFDPSTTGILFGDQIEYSKEVIDRASKFILTDSNQIMSLVYPLLKNKTILIPEQYTDRGDPYRFWSKGTLNTVRRYVAEAKINDSFQFDFAHNFAFTMAPSRIKEKLNLKNCKAIEDFNFLNFKSFRSLNYFLNLSIRDKKLYGNAIGKHWYGWVIAESPEIEVNELTYYLFSIKFSTNCVIKFHAEIEYLNNHGETIKSEVIMEPVDGNISKEVCQVFYTPQNTSKIKIRLKTWLSNNKFNYYIDYIKLYNISKNIEQNILPMKFSVKKNGEYYILLRLLKSRIGGRINLWLDGKYVGYIDTKDCSSNSLEWVKLKSFLNSGEHVFSIENVYGFNVLNIIVFVPVVEWNKRQKEIENIISNKEIEYIFEAEKLLKSGYKEKIDLNAGNGKTIIVRQVSDEFICPKIIEKTPQVTVWGNLRIKLKELCPDGACIFELKQTVERTNSSKINLLKKNGYYEVIYSFKDVLASPVFIKWKINNENWSKYNTLNIRVFGDNSGNTLKFWYYDNMTRRWVGIGRTNLNWYGWKNLTFEFPKYNRTTVKELNIQIDWRSNAAKKGLGQHKILLSKPILLHTSGFELKKSFEIIKSQKYTVMLHGKNGVFFISIGNNTEEIAFNSSLEWKNFSIYLSKGKHTIRVISPTKNAEIDTIIIKSCTHTKANIAKVFYYNQSTPTQWTVKIQAKTPFLLVFTEVYNPMWTATVNGKEIKSLPMYGVVNGYFINDTGSLDIIVEYKIQKYFEFCSKISAISLFICIVYITFAKGDKK